LIEWLNWDPIPIQTLNLIENPTHISMTFLYLPLKSITNLINNAITDNTEKTVHQKPIQQFNQFCMHKIENQITTVCEWKLKILRLWHFLSWFLFLMLHIWLFKCKLSFNFIPSHILFNLHLLCCLVSMKIVV